MQNSFEKTLAKLRKKSERQKRWISLGVSFAVTLVIFFVWYSNFMSSSQSPLPTENVAASASSTPANTSSDSSASVFDSISNKWSAVTGSLSDSDAAASSTDQSPLSASDAGN